MPNNDVTPEDGAQWLTENGDVLMREVRLTTDTFNEQVRVQLDKMKASHDNISIDDMFKMQMLMNKLSQLSEMSTGVISASHAALAAMARNVKS